MTQLRPGSTFSHYRIVDTLGRGGQATAFKADDLRLNRTVVVKALRPELTVSEVARRRFEREACLASALDNPHIQAVYDVGETEGLSYIVLQYVEGPTLQQFMNGRPLETLSALSIAIQLADALAVAHGSGIVHRDLKPANIIVAAGGQAKILDFGLAKMLAPEGGGAPGANDTWTELGVPYGSMGYSSPEQVAGESADHRTDVFSLGVVVYEMITGRTPFGGRHAVEMLSAVVNKTPPPIIELNPRAPVTLQPILDRALAKSSKDRYQTMAAFRDALKSLMRRLTRETGVVPTEPSTTLLPVQHARPAAWSLSGTLGRVLGRLRPPLPGLTARGARSGPRNGRRASLRPSSWGTEDRLTLAVLPFRNLAEDPDTDFYEFSLADGIISELAGVKSLVVRPSIYIAPYTGRTVDPREVGEDLATRQVLAGSFIRAGDRLRVTAQLVDVASGEMLWSDRIDVTGNDLIVVQDEIAERLLADLKIRLTAEEQHEIDRLPTASPQAYEFYMRGRDALHRQLLRTHLGADLDETVRLMHEAIGLDPAFARAHATLGRCYVLYAQGYGGPENFLLAERSLRRALELDPTLLDARLQMAYVDLHNGDRDRAHARTEELLKEAPDDPAVLFVTGMLHRIDGLYDKALRVYDRLLECHPGDLVLVAFNRARVYTHQGRFEEALAEIDRGREAEPEHPLLKTFLAVALFNRGLVDDAQTLLEEVVRQNPQFVGVTPLLAWCLSARGLHEEARALVTDRVREVASADHDIAFWLASFYAMEGMRSEAIEWAETAVRRGNDNYPLFSSSPRLAALRDEPRFAALLADMKGRWEARLRAEQAATA